MTYGYRPDNWSAFQVELERRGIAAADIERMELRPVVDAPADTGVTVILRSGRVESWNHRPAAEEA